MALVSDSILITFRYNGLCFLGFDLDKTSKKLEFFRLSL